MTGIDPAVHYKAGALVARTGWAASQVDARAELLESSLHELTRLRLPKRIRTKLAQRIAGDRFVWHREAPAEVRDIVSRSLRDLHGPTAAAAFRLGFDIENAAGMAGLARFEDMRGMQWEKVREVLNILRGQLDAIREEAAALGVSVDELAVIANELEKAQRRSDIDSIKARIEKVGERVLIELEVRMRPPAPDPKVMIIRFVFVLSLVAIVGGIVVAILGRTAETQLSIFGQEASSTSVGVILALLGTIVAILLFRRVMDSLSGPPPPAP